MGSSTSKYPDCECIENAESNAYHYNKKRCPSAEGHVCICKTSTIDFKAKKYEGGTGWTQLYTHSKYCQADKHPCICNGWWYVKAPGCKSYADINPKSCIADQHTCQCPRVDNCRANDHPCVCLSRGSSKCKAIKHKCVCKENYRDIGREEEKGICKGTKGHECLCKLDKSKCKACY